jgi:hypothetical protein
LTCKNYPYTSNYQNNVIYDSFMMITWLSAYVGI